MPDEEKPWLLVKPPTYDGSTDFLTFQTQYECAAATNNWTQDLAAKFLPNYLRDAAYQEWYRLPADVKANTAQTLTELRKVFTSADGQLHSIDFRQRVMQPGETIDAFKRALLSLFCRAYPNLTVSDATADVLLRDQFIFGLFPHALRERVMSQRPKSFQEAVAETRSQLQILKASARMGSYPVLSIRDLPPDSDFLGPSSVPSEARSPVFTVGRAPHEVDDRIQALERKFSDMEKKVEVISKIDTRMQALDLKIDKLCSSFERDCTVPSGPSQSGNSRPQRSFRNDAERWNLFCYRCAARNHVSADCPVPRTSLSCATCQRMGHTTAACMISRGNQQRPNQGN